MSWSAKPHDRGAALVQSEPCPWCCPRKRKAGKPEDCSHCQRTGRLEIEHVLTHDDARVLVEALLNAVTLQWDVSLVDGKPRARVSLDGNDWRDVKADA